MYVHQRQNNVYTYPDVGGISTLDDVESTVRQVNLQYGLIHQYVVVDAIHRIVCRVITDQHRVARRR